MEFSEQVVAVISECVVKVVKQLLADYNTQLNNKLKNIKITGDQIKPLSIAGTNISSGSITGANIGQGAITGSNIANQTISGENIANGTITGGNIADGAVSGNNIANGAITGSNIADGTITGSNIANGAITSSNIADGAISAAQIGDISNRVMEVVEADIYNANIVWANIDALTSATVDITKAQIQDAEIDTAQITNLNTEVMNTVVANIATANIDWASIEKLEAATAEISKATIQDAKIDWAQINEADVTVGNIANAQIKLADIDFAQIKDSVVGTQIITQGVAGEFYIDKLQVKQANIASLEAGQLLLRDSDDLLRQLYIDENGVVQTKVVEVNSDNIGTGVITGDKIAAGAVTDEQINAAAIFGNKGVVEELLVGVGTFGDIFANEAIVGQLKTHLITSDYLKIHIQDTVEIGATNLVKLSNTSYSSSDFIIASYEFGDSPPQDGELVTIRIKGRLGEGKICFNITNSGEDVHICNLVDLGDGTYGASSVVWHTTYTDSTGDEYTVDNSHILVRVPEESVTGVTSSIEWIMVERGTQMSDWSPAPEDASDITDQLEDKINSVAQQIMTPEQIVTTVRSDARYNNDLQQLQTAVTQTNSEFEIRMTKAESNIKSVSDTANATKETLDTWYHFGADALTIGKSDSEYKTRQSNKKYEFLYDETPVATLSGDLFEAPKMSVSDEFRIGGLCAVIDKTTGDIEWVWRGLPVATVSSFGLR